MTYRKPAGAPPPEAPKYQESFIPGDDDPLSAILGPNSTTAILGKPGEDVPEEILSILQEHGLSGKSYKTILKAVPEGCADDSNLPYVRSWGRAVPTMEYIAREYGPGAYKMVFTWRGKNENGEVRTSSDSIYFQVSDKYLQEYKNYQFEKKMKELEQKRERVRDLKLDGELEQSLGLGKIAEKDEIPVEEAAVKYVDNVASMAEKLGMTRASGFDWNKILPVLITGLPAFFKIMQDAETARRDESRQFLTLLMGTMNQNNNQMLELLKAQQNPRGADLTREMFDMIKGAIDVKEMIQGSGKESVADRIFNLIEMIGPHLLEVARLSAMQRATDPRMLLAKTYMQTNPDFKTMQQSPELQAEIVTRMDEIFGWKQTDLILAAIKLSRPEACPRDPAKELPSDRRETAPGPGTETENAPDAENMMETE